MLRFPAANISGSSSSDGYALPSAAVSHFSLPLKLVAILVMVSFVDLYVACYGSELTQLEKRITSFQVVDADGNLVCSAFHIIIFCDNDGDATWFLESLAVGRRHILSGLRPCGVRWSAVGQREEAAEDY
ncbi:hypothetical protein L1887_19717 [Cichorium endivia]|nr:hypothetical protein L1887_19717 [Cichorium endivia]